MLVCLLGAGLAHYYMPCACMRVTALGVRACACVCTGEYMSYRQWTHYEFNANLTDPCNTRTYTYTAHMYTHTHHASTT